jgi:hypothetical protein
MYRRVFTNKGGYMRNNIIKVLLGAGLLMLASSSLAANSSDESVVGSFLESLFGASSNQQVETMAGIFNDAERSRILEYYKHHRDDELVEGTGSAKKSKKKKLPPGLQKKLARGGELPPGWQTKVRRGEVLDAD